MSLSRPAGPLSLIVVLLPLTFVSGVRADSWARPTPRIFASPWGHHGFKLLEPQFLKTAKGHLIRLNEQGEEETIWQRDLVNVPHRVFVGDRTSVVVTVDTYGKLGSDHSIVVYGKTGKVLADYRLDEILSPVEILLAVPRTVSSSRWANQAKFRFSPNEKQFIIRFQWPDDFQGKVDRLEKQLEQIEDPRIAKKMSEMVEQFQTVSATVKGGERIRRIDLETGQWVETPDGARHADGEEKEERSSPK